MTRRMRSRDGCGIVSAVARRIAYSNILPPRVHQSFVHSVTASPLSILLGFLLRCELTLLALLNSTDFGRLVFFATRCSPPTRSTRRREISSTDSFRRYRASRCNYIIFFPPLSLATPSKEVSAGHVRRRRHGDGYLFQRRHRVHRCLVPVPLRSHRPNSSNSCTS